MEIKLKKHGGRRTGAGRKPTGSPPTTAIRVDERLLPFLQEVKTRGVDDNLINKLLETLK